MGQLTAYEAAYESVRSTVKTTVASLFWSGDRPSVLALGVFVVRGVRA
ncbi:MULTISPECIES: hypothetical protein [Streptomyces]